MFSFRTTPIEEQSDKTLHDGQVGCFCTQNSWNTRKNCYLHEIFAARGNLNHVFTTGNAELSPINDHIVFNPETLRELQAVVVEIQDVGSRYFNYSNDVFKLMEIISTFENPPSLYIVDHINPAGRIVEGTMPSSDAGSHVPKIAHRHGLTLGEAANLYLNELGGRFPLHVISAIASGNVNHLMPWTIAPASDIPGLFTCDMYSGGCLWNYTNVSPGIGTPRPYEYIGAPFVKMEDFKTREKIPIPEGVMMRSCSFIPAYGRYEGQICYGCQIMLEPGTEYHSLMHTLQLIRYLKSTCPEFTIESGFQSKLADDTLLAFIDGDISWNDTKEHLKTEEQKWIRKARKFLLYDDAPYRIK